MLFLHLADLKLVAEALRSRIDRQKARLAEIRKLHRQWAGMLPSGSSRLMQHTVEQSRLDVRWLSAVLADVEAGRIRDTPDPARFGASNKKLNTETRRKKIEIRTRDERSWWPGARSKVGTWQGDRPTTPLKLRKA